MTSLWFYVGMTSHFASAEETHEKFNSCLSLIVKTSKNCVVALEVEAEKLSGFKVVLQTTSDIHLLLCPQAFSLTWLYTSSLNLPPLSQKADCDYELEAEFSRL